MNERTEEPPGGTTNQPEAAARSGSTCGPVGCILAAGESRRLGRPKALVEIGDRTVLESLAIALRELTDPTPVLVVTGAHDEEIRQHVRRLDDSAGDDVELVHNRWWKRGRTGSIQTAHRERVGRDVMIAPVDVPLIRGTTVVALEAEWLRRGSPAMGWLAPRQLDTRRFGHPVIIGRELLKHVDALGADTPLSRLRPLAAPLMALDLTDPAILDDLDTRADLIALRAAWRARHEGRLGLPGPSLARRDTPSSPSPPRPGLLGSDWRPS